MSQALLRDTQQPGRSTMQVKHSSCSPNLLHIDCVQAMKEINKNAKQPVRSSSCPSKIMGSKNQRKELQIISSASLSKRSLQTMLKQISRIDLQRVKSRATSCMDNSAGSSEAKSTEDMTHEFLEFDRLYEFTKQNSILGILSKSQRMLLAEDTQEEKSQGCGNVITKNETYPKHRRPMQEFSGTATKNAMNRVSLPTYSPFDGKPLFEKKLKDVKQLLEKYPKAENTASQCSSKYVDLEPANYLPPDHKATEITASDMNMTYLPAWSLENQKSLQVMRK